MHGCTPPLLDEAIHYQETIGVDHVHMVAEPSILGIYDYIMNMTLMTSLCHV